MSHEVLRESRVAIPGVHENRLAMARHPAHGALAQLHLGIARARREAEPGPAFQRLRLRLVEVERHVMRMKRTGHAAHGDLENGVQWKIHVKAVSELKERGQLGEPSA